jgi:drug/metabolite transporter (DMT)-like permease
MNQNKLAVIYMAVASFFFFLMSSMVKLSKGIPIGQIVFFRGFFAFIFCIIQLRVLKISPWGINRKLLFLRGFFGTIALILFFYTLSVIPLASAVIIQYLSPIFTIIFTVLFLKEKIYPKQVLFLALAFIGVIIIKGVGTNTISIIPFFAGVCSAVFSALAYTVIRKIKKDEHPLVIIFYFPLVTLPMVFPFIIKGWVWPSYFQWATLFGVGVFVQFAQYFMTKSYQLGEANLVSVVGYLGVIWATVGGYFFFEEEVLSSTLVGISFILVGVVGNTVYKMLYKKS